MTDLSTDVLKQPGKDEKKLFVQTKLLEINQFLPAQVYIPFVNSSIRNYAILNIVAEEAKVFITKERAPLMLTFEMYRPTEITIDENAELRGPEAPGKPRLPNQAAGFGGKKKGAPHMNLNYTDESAMPLVQTFDEHTVSMAAAKANKSVLQGGAASPEFAIAGRKEGKKQRKVTFLDKLKKSSSQANLKKFANNTIRIKQIGGMDDDAMPAEGPMQQSVLNPDARSILQAPMQLNE